MGFRRNYCGAADVARNGAVADPVARARTASGGKRNDVCRCVETYRTIAIDEE
jgi:hypothetical protein